MHGAVLALFFGVSSALAAVYQNTENIVGAGFYNSFNFEAIPDPTAGRVNYVDQATATSTNLTFASGDKFVLRADDTTVLDPSSAGRNSVRLQSKNAYSTHVAVFDIAHMPQGCGTWPAVWETGGAWPYGGETDILEGVNDQGTDQSTLHTAPGCTMPDSRPETGLAEATSYGPAFNANGGGWYAMERTSDFIYVWFWARGDSSVPSDVAAGGSTVDTQFWGTPSAAFPDTSCDIGAFVAHNIIINLTFCGAWAGDASVYASSGCPSTCDDFVNNNPSAFSDAFFEFNAINVYT
ncbi:glycoside hydrolase family 16 protein [Mycena rosella]|uniref:Glycoside hydrolase family 16 protein n=1 Tax=Mycena rosella TaxID=1033263 RepID=A0AAD7G8Y1_MYCRO|nr:glycoside hydrolase family 16 protein [Mycena rosella]